MMSIAIVFILLYLQLTIKLKLFIMDPRVQQFMAMIKARNPGDNEFHQAVQEVAESLIPFIEENPKYKHAKILERIAEPERTIIFRVPWLDDKGEVQINRGYRIEMNSAIGPYKGGLRLHPTVNPVSYTHLRAHETR